MCMYVQVQYLNTLTENTLLSVSDVAHTVRTLPERKLSEGYRLVGKIESTREKVLLGFHQVTPHKIRAYCTVDTRPCSNSSWVRLLGSQLQEVSRQRPHSCKILTQTAADRQFINNYDFANQIFFVFISHFVNILHFLSVHLVT